MLAFTRCGTGRLLWLVIPISAACARASVIQVQTPDGPGYELSCSERSHCFAKAEELCDSGYVTISEAIVGHLYVQCDKGNALETNCTNGKNECMDSAYQQCGSSYEARNYYEKTQLVVRCSS